MKLRPVLWSLALCLLIGVSQGQTIHERETFSGLTNPQAISETLPGPQYMREHVVEGKLRLSLQDAVILALANNSQVRLQQLNVQNAKYSLLRAHSPFDPLAGASISALRSTSPTSNELQGAQTLSTLTQTMQFNYAQTFETGTSIQAGLGADKLSTNSVFNFLNPSFSSNLSFQFTQPLLRSRWLFANRAPLVVARRNLNISRATFAAQISDAILRVVTEYWGVVQARGNLGVARKSQDQAEASYKRDKRALELGALPPLDIYRSESQVASRRVQVIQAEYALKQAEDLLRFSVGATIDPYIQALDLELTENPEAPGELRTADLATGLQQALQKRPELEAIGQSLANDDTSIRLAHNNLLPDLRLSGSYSSNGVGGNSFDTSVTPPQLISQGGLGDSLNQVFRFGFPTYGFTLSLNLPIKNRGAQADLGNALVSRRRDLYSDRQLRQQITLEVGNAVHQLEEAKLSVAASKEALDLAQKNLAAEQRKYELGGQTIFFVLEAQTELAQAEQGLLQAEVGYQIAVAAVDHATGDLLNPYGVQIADLNK
jgi:outer membrane protein TolC